MESTFERDVAIILSAGCLETFQWTIDFQTETCTNLRPDARILERCQRIANQWAMIEQEHGEGCMLVEENSTIQKVLKNKNSLLNENPTILQNSRQLRALKGEDWWLEKHRYQNYE